MFVDVLAPKCAGKSQLIAHLVHDGAFQHVDIRTLSPPSFTESMRHTLRGRASRAAFAGLCARGEWRLASRYSTFLALERTAATVPQSAPSVYDEGVLKKLLEAVPLGIHRELRSLGRWESLMRELGNVLVAGMLPTVDLLVQLRLHPDTYMARARERGFAHDANEADIRAWFGLQQQFQTALVREAQRVGLPACVLDAEDAAHCAESLCLAVRELAVAP